MGIYNCLGKCSTMILSPRLKMRARILHDKCTDHRTHKCVTILCTLGPQGAQSVQSLRSRSVQATMVHTRWGGTIGIHAHSQAFRGCSYSLKGIQPIQTLEGPIDMFSNKTGPLERKSMSVCHPSKMDEDTFLATYVSIDWWKAHFLGFLMVYESCMLIESVGCYGPSKVTYQKVTIDW